LFRKTFWITCFCAAALFSQDRISLENQLKQLGTTSADRFSFAVIGDRTGAAPDSWGIFDKAIAELNGLRPDFCFMVGDLIEGGPDPSTLEDQWDEAARHVASLRCPLFLLAGNHDLPSAKAYAVWTRRVGKTYYAFEAMGCQFLVLNTEEAQGTGESGFGKKQLEFAERVLSAVPVGRPVFVLMHQPAWFGNGTLKTQWSRLEPLLPASTAAVIAGHLHALAMKKQNGRNYLIVGPTGAKLRMERNPAMGLVQHTTLITVENGRSTFLFIEPGRIFSEQTALEAYDRYLKGLLLLRGHGGY
jgi:3',5'-cyclic AMP phosphodiesterase CpdA